MTSSTRITLAGALVALTAACSYRAAIPEGVVACGNKQRASCPAGFHCAPLPNNPDISVCTQKDTPDGAADTTPPKDTRPPTPDTAPDVPAPPPDVAPDEVPVDMRPPDAPVDTPMDLAPMDLAPPDAADASPPACPASTGGPALVPAGKFCVDESEVTNQQYRTFLDQVVRGDLTLPAECAAKVDFVPPSSPEVPWDSQRPANFPVVNVDWCDAYAFCAWAGKRLCGRIGGGVLAMNQSASPTLSQWGGACSRGGARLYPYGQTAVDGACNTRKPRMPIAFGAVKSYPICEGGYPGLFDLVGNVEEWIDACGPSSTKGGDCAVVGGAFAPESENPDCLSWFPGHRLEGYFRRGFRCCSKN